MNPTPFTVVVGDLSSLYSTLLYTYSDKAECSNSSLTGTIVSAFSPRLPGHTDAHNPQPTQLSGEIWIRNDNPSTPLPIGFNTSLVISSGAFLISSSVIKNGRIVA